MALSVLGATGSFFFLATEVLSVLKKRKILGAEQQKKKELYTSVKEKQ